MQEPPRRDGWSRWGAAARLGGLAAAYYGLARLGLLFALPESELASPIWPSAGLALAAVVLWGPRALPAIFAGASAIEWTYTRSIPLAVLLGAGNTAAAALGGWLVARAGGAQAFSSLQGVARFAGAVALAPIVAATVGTGGLLLLGQLPVSDMATVWGTWYLGDAAGTLVVGPVVVLLHAMRARPLARGLLAETGLAVVLLLGAAAQLFGLVPQVPPGHPALVVLLLPPLVWAAFRLGPAPAAVALLALDAMAVAVTRAGRGPFTAAHAPDAFLVLQAFVFAVGLLCLGLAALASERRAAAAGLEVRVRERTAALEELNGRLRVEVDERQRAQALADEAQRAAHMGTWRWDVEKPNAEWSPELYRIYGLDPAQHTPSYADYLTRVHPDDAERVKSATEDVFRHKRPYSHDERIRRPDGTWRHLHTWAHAVTDADGKLVALVGACQDITARVHDEQALQESLERFRALSDAAPIGIVHTRADGTVDYVNDKWRQITGVPDHRDRERMRSAVHPEDQPRMADLWRACVREGREFNGHMRFVHPDGAVRSTACKAEPVRNAAGAITGFVSTVEDITDRLAAEAKDREVRRLREQAEFKTNFLRTAAHELGTPLTPIKIQVRILRRLLEARTDAEAGGERKAVEILDRNISRLHVLVQDMLESARLQSGRLRLAARSMDLAHTVHEVVETFQEPAIQTGIALDTEAPAELPIVADPDRLAQVLYNLLSNAMKFTPTGGRVTVQVAEEAAPGSWPPALADAGAVRVTVRDTGAGFPSDQAARLFQPFSQLHDPLDRPRGGGSGLGLYISRGIVEQHGGTMAGSSPGPGRGATFSFLLPRVAAPPTNGHGTVALEAGAAAGSVNGPGAGQ